MQWLKTQKGFKMNAELFAEKCRGGNLEMIKGLRSEGCPLSIHACWGAAAGGHLEALKWLRSEGCPWDERTCRRAASGDHLDVLKYAREHGCPWDVWTWYRAGEATREWLMEIDCPWVHFDPDDHDPELYDDSDIEDADIRHAALYRPCFP